MFCLTSPCTDFILSDLLQRKQHCREALDLAGQALLIRVNTYGIVDDRTAESHIALGMLYRRLGHYDKSRQELYIGTKNFLFRHENSVTMILFALYILSTTHRSWYSLQASR